MDTSQKTPPLKREVNVFYTDFTRIFTSDGSKIIFIRLLPMLYILNSISAFGAFRKQIVSGTRHVRRI